MQENKLEMQRLYWVFENSQEESVKSYNSKQGVSPSDFVLCLLKDFGHSHFHGGELETNNSVSWKEIGLFVSPVFFKAYGCPTMVGPINDVMKPKRIYRKRKKPTEVDRPQETVENLFALSFLAEDGWVDITVEANGSHLVSPKNAPSRKVNYNRFVFRFDFEDWKIMKDVVPVGEELMPHRSVSIATNVEAVSADIPMAMPIRKVSRNQGHKISIAQEYPQGCFDAAMRLLPFVAVASPN